MQVPVIATLLAVISKQNRDFPAVVLDKLCFIVTISMQEGDVLVAKLGLRCLACLASAQCLALDGEGGLSGVLAPLLEKVDAALADASAKPDASRPPVALMQGDGDVQSQGAVACYLLASTLPWCTGALTKVCANYSVLYATARTNSSSNPTPTPSPVPLRRTLLASCCWRSARRHCRA